ncbi:MAG: hypothetical protein IKP51_07045 [Treponema sp.]|nr:hypothetical protein [Treponema sp.]
MENTFTVQVTCKDEELAARYEALAKKMASDADFNAQLPKCKSEEELYNLYLSHGYTDLSFEDFVEQLGYTVEQINSAAGCESMELTECELENVVGGFSFFKFATSVVSVIPIAGPIISGVAKAVKAGIDGEGASGIVLELAKGAGLAMVDAVVTIATAGVGSGVSMGIKVGMGAIKAGINEAA